MDGHDKVMGHQYRRTDSDVPESYCTSTLLVLSTEVVKGKKCDSVIFKSVIIRFYHYHHVIETTQYADTIYSISKM